MTLGYFERTDEEAGKRALLDAILEINAEVAREPLVFRLPAARLHRYDHLSEFVTRPHYPVYKL